VKLPNWIIQALILEIAIFLAEITKIIPIEIRAIGTNNKLNLGIIYVLFFCLF
jgi:hypothetical protein